MVFAVGGHYLSYFFIVDSWVTHCSFWFSHIFGPVGLQSLLATFTPNLMLQQHKWTELCDKEVLPNYWICLVALVSDRLHAWLAAPRRHGLWQISQAQLPDKCLAKVVNIFLNRTRSVFVIVFYHEWCSCVSVRHSTFTTVFATAVRNSMLSSSPIISFSFFPCRIFVRLSLESLPQL